MYSFGVVLFEVLCARPAVIARKCLGEKGGERPTMGEVLWNLEQAWLQQQESDCFQNDGNYGEADKTTANGLSVIVDVDGVPLHGAKFAAVRSDLAS